MPSRIALILILATSFLASARADISFYLRTLISGHHDTLAVKVK